MKKICKFLMGLSLVICAMTFVGCKGNDGKYNPIRIESGVMAEDLQELTCYIDEFTSHVLDLELKPTNASFKDLDIEITGDNVINCKNGVITLKKDVNGKYNAGIDHITISAKKGTFSATCTIKVVKSVATVNGIRVSSVAEISTALENSETIENSIKLLDNITITEGLLNVGNGKTLNIDLNGKNIRTATAIVSNGNLNILNNNSNFGSKIIASENAIVVGVTGNVDVDKVDIENTIVKSSTQLENERTLFAVVNDGTFNCSNAKIEACCGVYSSSDSKIENADIVAEYYTVITDTMNKEYIINSSYMESKHNAVLVINDAYLEITDTSILAEDIAILGGGSSEMNVDIVSSTVQSKNNTAILVNSQGNIQIDGGVDINESSLIRGKTAISILMGDVSIIGNSQIVSTSLINTSLTEYETDGKLNIDGSAIMIITNYKAFSNSNNNLNLHIANDVLVNGEIKQYTALNQTSTNVLVDQVVNISNSSSCSIKYAPTPLVFANTTYNISRSQLEDNPLMVAPILPFVFESNVLVYEFTYNDNLQYQVTNSNGNKVLATISESTGLYDSKVYPTNDNALYITLASENGLDAKVDSFEIRVTAMYYTGAEAVNNPIITITVNLDWNN